MDSKKGEGPELKGTYLGSGRGHDQTRDVAP